MGPLLRRLGGTVDVAGLPVEDAAVAIARSNPDGILALADNRLEWTAQVAARLDLPFMSPQAAARATDKYLQRVALRDAGLPGSRLPPRPRARRQRRLGAPGRGRALPRRAQAAPQRGEPRHPRGRLAAERARGPRRDVPPASSARDAARGVPDGGSGRRRRGLRELCLGRERRRRRLVSHIAISGRTPLAEPFRETGAFVPAAIGAERGRRRPRRSPRPPPKRSASRRAACTPRSS